MAPFPVPQHVPFPDAYLQVVDQLVVDVVAFNGIILQLSPEDSVPAHEELLRSAIERPFTTTSTGFVYSDGMLQAAALLYALIQNHPFVDGNKRTAYWACAYFLLRCGYWHDAIFLNRREARTYEKLVLDIAREGEDLRRGRLRARHTVDEIANRLDRTLAGSRNRPGGDSRQRRGLCEHLARLFRRDS